MRDIAQIVIPIADLERAEDFYSQVLGLKKLFSAPDVHAFAVGSTRLLLTLRQSFVPDEEPGILIYFGVEGLSRRYEDLVRRGAGEGGAPHVVARLGSRDIWIAFVIDPFGNRLGLIEEIEVA